MNPFQLAKTLTSAGIPTRVRIGYWGSYSQLWKALALRVVNMAIRLTGAQGRRLAPYYLLYGDRT